MKIVFFGTPLFSAEILKDLVEKGISVLAVVTQPDKVQGRHLKFHESAVKKIAKEYLPNVPILQPKKVSSDSFIETISAIEADLFVVVAFGQIFPTNLLKMPPLGCVNVHTSLLPKYRGAAPIQRVLMNGEKETGSTIMYMVEKCDAGDILAMKTLPIPQDMNAGELTIALCELSKDLLSDTLKLLYEGKITPQSQDPSKVTFAKKVNPEDAQIDWSETAKQHFNQYRGVTPKPGAWCFIWIREKKLRLKLLKIKTLSLNGKSKEILEFNAQRGFIVACKEGALSIETLQLEGKKAIDASAFTRGYAPGEISFSPPASSSL